jgi:hypothetical protein
MYSSVARSSGTDSLKEKRGRRSPVSVEPGRGAPAASGPHPVCSSCPQSAVSAGRRPPSGGVDCLPLSGLTAPLHRRQRITPRAPRGVLGTPAEIRELGRFYGSLLLGDHVIDRRQGGLLDWTLQPGLDLVAPAEKGCDHRGGVTCLWRGHTDDLPRRASDRTRAVRLPGNQPPRRPSD